MTTPLLWTTRKYGCGCIAEGYGDVPAYCSEHGTPPFPAYSALLLACEPFVNLVEGTSGRIPVEHLSGADWRSLCKAYADVRQEQNLPLVRTMADANAKNVEPHAERLLRLAYLIQAEVTQALWEVEPEKFYIDVKRVLAADAAEKAAESERAGAGEQAQTNISQKEFDALVRDALKWRTSGLASAEGFMVPPKS